MIIDLRSSEAVTELSTDVCIVGAGAAGITLALELSKAGVGVCLLESGGLEIEPATQALCDGESVGHQMQVNEGRYRVLGGATSRWTGRCATLDEIDFARRPWIPYSGWPISRAALDPYYARALAYCGFEAPWSDAIAQAAQGRPAPPLQEDGVIPFLWRYAPNGVRRYKNWGRFHLEDLKRAPGVTVFLHANATAFSTDGVGRVLSLTACALNGRQVRVQASNVVLCGGGIENARLLLASRRTVRGGLGTDAVGRYFMQHPRGVVGEVQSSAETILALQDTFNVFTRRHPPQYEIGFALSEAAQRRDRLLNCSAILTYEADPHSGWEQAKAAARAARVPWRAAPLTLGALKDLPNVAKNLGRRLRGRHPLLTVKRTNVLIDLEQAPDPDSRITLSDAKDRLDMPLAKVDWRVSELERTTARRFSELLGEAFTMAGLGRVEPSSWLYTREPITAADLEGTYHHIGTTRMTSDPARGAVNADCRVHGVENLYVAGCSVFPTGGHANPTLTIVALAVRLADHLSSNAARRGDGK